MKAKEQNDSNLPNDDRPFVFVAKPDGTSEGLVCFNIKDLDEFCVAYQLHVQGIKYKKPKNQGRMIELIIACAVTSPLTPVDIHNYILCSDTQEKVEHVIEWYPTVEEHFEVEDILKAMLINILRKFG